MGAQLTTTSVPFGEDSETVVITRAIQSGLNLTQQTIYSGPGDFQPGSSSEFFDPGGSVQTIEAVLVIDAPTLAALPPVKPEDVVMVNGNAYSVIDAQPWGYGGMPHLEITLKKGPQEYQGPR